MNQIHYRPDESATAALGRIAYNAVEQREPSKETKSELSNLVHWSNGILQGGLYGVSRGEVEHGDVGAGWFWAPAFGCWVTNWRCRCWGCKMALRRHRLPPTSIDWRCI